MARRRQPAYCCHTFDARTPSLCVAGKNRCLELQVQGKFLRAPKGTLWMGGVIGDKMKLSWLLQAFCGALLAVIRKLSPGAVHHSFGESSTEKPCIVSTWHHFVDRMVITTDGETPPVLGDGDVKEPDADRKARKKSKVVPPINVGATYTFSIYTMYVDLLSWKVIKLPGLKPFDLHTFWGDQSLTLGMYDLPGDVPNPKVHPDIDRNYFFQFQFLHDRKCSNPAGGS
jgi:hypothetical protein